MINATNLIPVGLWATNVLLSRTSYFLATGSIYKIREQVAIRFNQPEHAQLHKSKALNAWKKFSDTEIERRISLAMMAILLVGLMRDPVKDYAFLGIVTGVHVVLSAWTQRDVEALVEAESKGLMN